MAGIIYIPTANAADVLTGAILDSDAASGTTSTGLVQGTEYRAFALSDPSSPFTPVGRSITFLDGQFSTSPTPAVFTPVLTGSTAGDTLFIGVSLETATVAGTMSVSLGANNADLIFAADATSSRPKAALYRVTHPGGSPSLTISTSNNLSFSHFAMWKVVGAASAPVTSASFAPGNPATPQSLNLNTTSGNFLFVLGGATGANGQTYAITGAGTAAYTNSNATDLWTSAFHALVLGSSETPRSVSASWTPTSARAAGIAITI